MLIVCFLAVSSGFSVPNTRTQKFVDQVSSLVSQNSKGLSLALHEGEFVLKTNERIHREDPVLVMDGKFTISTFDTFPLLDLVQNESLDMILITRLLYEKYIAKGSFISNYVQFMPHEQYCFGNWTLEMIFEYNAKRTFPRDSLFPIEVEKAHRTFLELIEGQEVPVGLKELESWKWAACIVSSKAANVSKNLWKRLRKFPEEPGDSTTEGKILIPIFDLVVFKPLPLVYAAESFSPLIVDQGSAYIKADRPFLADSLFSLSREMSANNELLVRFGQVVLKNPYDFLPVRVHKVENCRGIDRGNGICEFRLQAFSVNSEMREHFSSYLPQISADLSYRDQLQGVSFTLPLSAVLQVSTESPQSGLLRGYLLSEYYSYYRVLSLIDQQLLLQLLKQS